MHTQTAYGINAVTRYARFDAITCNSHDLMLLVIHVCSRTPHYTTRSSIPSCPKMGGLVCDVPPQMPENGPRSRGPYLKTLPENRPSGRKFNPAHARK